ncbi:hypothetical protein XENORESO_016330, partial [Xenotaenia resolanae]
MCVIIELFNPQIKLFTDLMEDLSLKEEEAEAADLIKQNKANNELKINNGQPSAVERQDSPKDATLKPPPRRSLFKDQDVSHKRISPVQQEAKSGSINSQTRPR